MRSLICVLLCFGVVSASAYPAGANEKEANAAIKNIFDIFDKAFADCVNTAHQYRNKELFHLNVTELTTAEDHLNLVKSNETANQDFHSLIHELRERMDQVGRIHLHMAMLEKTAKLMLEKFPDNLNGQDVVDAVKGHNEKVNVFKTTWN